LFPACGGWPPAGHKPPLGTITAFFMVTSRRPRSGRNHPPSPSCRSGSRRFLQPCCRTRQRRERQHRSGRPRHGEPEPPVERPDICCRQYAPVVFRSITRLPVEER
jgi:hypothetical protein